MKNKNAEMYGQVKMLYDGGTVLDYEMIDGIFDLDGRTKSNLRELREFVAAKAGVDGLGTVLTECIDSTICTHD